MHNKCRVDSSGTMSDTPAHSIHPGYWPRSTATRTQCRLHPDIQALRAGPVLSPSWLFQPGQGMQRSVEADTQLH